MWQVSQLTGLARYLRSLYIESHLGSSQLGLSPNTEFYIKIFHPPRPIWVGPYQPSYNGIHFFSSFIIIFICYDNFHCDGKWWMFHANMTATCDNSSTVHVSDFQILKLLLCWWTSDSRLDNSTPILLSQCRYLLDLYWPSLYILHTPRIILNICDSTFSDIQYLRKYKHSGFLILMLM